jgi:hypothetical protein
MDSIEKEDCIALALEELANQEKPNFRSTARKYKLDRTTLRRRHDSTQCSIRESQSETHQHLTSTQEEVLIGYINKLTERSIPPTSQFVKNFAEEICKKEVSKNWVSGFTRRYKDQLCTGYLCTIDQKHIGTESIPLITRFFELVSTLL